MKSLVAVAVALLAVVPSLAHAQECPASGGSSLSSLLTDVAAAADKPVRKSRVRVITPAKNEWGRFLDQVEKAEIKVPHRDQEGPTCAINAIGMLMDFYEKDTGFKAPPTYGEGGLFEKAKELGLTKTGGFFVQNSPFLVKEFSAHYVLQGFRPGVGKFSDLRALVESGTPAIVSYSVPDGSDDSADSLKPDVNGPSAHAVVVTAIVTDEAGKTWVIARDGNKKGAYHWPADDFQAAWEKRGSIVFFMTPFKPLTPQTCGVGTSRNTATAAAPPSAATPAAPPRTASVSGSFFEP